MLSNIGSLIGRVVVGGTLAAHGAQKAFGWFGGPGPAGVAPFMESLGYAPGELFGTIAGATEMAAGSLMVLGLGGPLGPALALPPMIVAQGAVHAKNGFFAQDGGIEVPLLYCAAALLVASAGYGTLSLDAALGAERVLGDERLIWAVLVGAAAAGLITLAQRDVPAPTPDPAA